MANWDARFIALARHVAGWSKDRSQGIGAVIVGFEREVRAMGYNGFPRSVNDDVDERHERPEKYFWTEHAERNAIYNAARVGTPLDGCTIYCSWFPCVACARAIIQSGIKVAIVRAIAMDHPKYGPEFKRAIDMLVEGGVTIVYHEED